MKFHLLERFSRSASFELDNKDRYWAPQPYTVTCNGSVVWEDKKENVFSLYDLEPDTAYEVTVTAAGESYGLSFQTEAETVLLNVVDFGAVGNAMTDSTAAIQAAILSCPKGGTVLVPAGTYRCGPLFLQSDMTFWLAEDAVLLGKTDRREYPILPGESTTEDAIFPLGTWEGDPNACFASLLTGIHLERVNIIGLGRVDANAQNSDWWDDVKTMRTAWRPRTLFLNHCNQVRIQGVTFANSPSWTVHPYYCDDLSFADIRIVNPAISPNTDGLNPESCHRVKIVGARISVGDDCIALKSGKIHMATTRHKNTKDVSIRNCFMERGHGAVVIGSEVAGGIEDIKITQCYFLETDRGLRIKTRRGRGEASVLTGILLENVTMSRVLSAFTVNMYYFCDPDGHSDYVQSREPLPIDYRTPKVGSFTCRDVVCEDCQVSGGYFYGLPEQPVEEIVMERVRISFAPKEERQTGFPVMADHVPEVEGLGFFADNVKTLTLEDFVIEDATGEPLQLHAIQQINQK